MYNNISINNISITLQYCIVFLQKPIVILVSYTVCNLNFETLDLFTVKLWEFCKAKYIIIVITIMIIK